MSSRSSVPVDCLAGSTAAKIATATVPEPGMAVFDNPTMMAATPSRVHANQVSSVTSGPGDRQSRFGERGRARCVLHPQGGDSRTDAVSRDARGGGGVLLGEQPRIEETAARAG